MANDRKHEEMLGEALKGSAVKQTVDLMLGQPYVAERSVVPGMQRSESDHGMKTPEERFADLQAMAATYLDEEDEAILAHAFDFANAAHKGVTRKSGEPYILHPIEVAIILADLRMDVDTLCAALLHDTVEDTDVTPEDVEREFNAQVRQLVEGVTKITRIEVESLSDKQVATIRKMFVAMSKDIRVIVIKLADRLHNMRTLAALREDRRIFKARETLEIYAPIAHRLGINSIKWELEDLSFFYLEPNKYKQVSRMVTESRAEREAYLADVIAIIRDEMSKVGIQAQVMGRPKHLYSIYQKMAKKGKGLLRDLRPHRGARHREVGARLLFGARRGSHAVAPDARALQGLHRHAQVQHVPVAAHDGDGAGGASARGPDPHRGDASRQRIRRRRALAL